MYMKKSESFNKAKIFFKEKKYNKVVRKRRFRPIKKTKNKVVQSVKRKKALTTLFVLLIILIVVSTVFTGIIFAGKSIIALRNRNQNDVVVGNVFGLDGVVEYPNSEFIFKDILDDESVKNFLSLGNSVYRLTDDSSVSDVFEYYRKKLPQNGWEHRLSVPITSEDMMYGEYWIKDGKGLRIYSRLNDIWYETVSISQAENGMKDIVQKEVARKLLLMTSEKVDLLPNYPWLLSYPSEYVTKYYATDISSFQGVEIKKIGSNNKVYIEPVGYFGAVNYDAFLEKYLKTYNKREKAKWSVINSRESNVSKQVVIKGIITNGKDNGEVVIIRNISNSVVYAISSFEEKDPFFNYVLENIEPAVISSTF